MQARRGTALLLSCVLGLLLLAPIHAGAQPQHAVRGVALLAPAGVELPHTWRSAPDDALPADAVRASTTSVRVAGAVAVRALASYDTRTTMVRGPPGSAVA